MLSCLHGNRPSADQILKEIYIYNNGLNHQKSEAIISNNMDNRFVKSNANANISNKNNSVFQSLIFPSNTLGARQSFNENNASAWDKNEYRIQIKDISFAKNPIIHVNSKPVIESKGLIPQ